MQQPPTTIDLWDSTTKALLETSGILAAKLERAYSNADETFADRAEKVPNPLKVILEECRRQVEMNFESAKKQQSFLVQLIATRDSALRAAIIDKQPFAQDPFLLAAAAAQDSASIARVLADTAKIGAEILSLCVLLTALFGHREAQAFDVGAKKELIGALGDPGSGVLTLLKRLHAVSSRTLRTDQDAANVLAGLENFRRSMEKWRAVNASMANGQSFAQAVETEFTITP